MNIAIVEDNPIHSQRLSEYLNRFQTDHQISFEIHTFSSGMQLLENYSAIWDILFIDIELPYINGMSLSQEIRKIDSNVIIVFVTNLTQYAIKGYSVQAFDYIIKPIKYASLSITMSKILAVLERQNTSTILLKLKNGMHVLPVSSIYYVEVQLHNLIFYTSEGIYTIRGTLSAIEKKLGSGFARCSNSFLVNLSHVNFLSKESVTVGSYKLSVSRRFYTDFFQKLSVHLERTTL